MKSISRKINSRQRRHNRVRAKVVGTSDMPRLSVFRSNRYTSLQIIDDKAGKTLLSVTNAGEKAKGTKTDKAKIAGKKIAELALEKKIKTVVFDKGGYRYHGRVKAAAEGAREGGLKF